MREDQRPPLIVAYRYKAFFLLLLSADGPEEALFTAIDNGAAESAEVALLHPLLHDADAETQKAI